MPTFFISIFCSPILKENQHDRGLIDVIGENIYEKPTSNY
jgi:dihydroorotase